MTIPGSTVLLHIKNRVGRALPVGSEKNRSGLAKQEKKSSDQLHQRLI
jgi:hypothetical protein